VRFLIGSTIQAAKPSGDPTLRMQVAIYDVARCHDENHSPYIAAAGSSAAL